MTLDDKIKQQDSHYYVNGIPDGSAKGDLKERLEQHGQGTKEHAHALAFRLEVVIREIDERNCCCNSYQLIETIWHISQAK